MTNFRNEPDPFEPLFDPTTPDVYPCGAIIDDSGLCSECGHDWSEIIHLADNPPDDFVPDQGA